MNKALLTFISCFTILLLYDCSPKVYTIETIRVRRPKVQKNTLKPGKVFIQNAYADLENEIIDNTKLEKLNYTLSSSGDRQAIEQLIIQDFLFYPSKGLYGQNADSESRYGEYDDYGDGTVSGNPELEGLDIPTREEMLTDPEAFIKETYIKFYNREPREEEFFFLKEYVQNEAVTPILIYYAIMSSDEYRYY